MFRLLPDQASTAAGRVDLLFWVLVWLSLLFAIPIVLAIVAFCVRYRRGSRAERAGSLATSMGLELSWTIIPLFLALGIFGWGSWLFFDLARPPADALEINVVGKQWMWKVQHPMGQREINELHVPLGRPVKLIMTSQDVIHDFYLPAFRVRHDVIPGRYTTVWFEATQPGRYRLYCTEFCGTDHAAMVGWVIVMPPAEYEQWLTTGSQPETLAAAGERLFRQRGCSGCHRLDGSGVAPTLAGVYGKPVPLADGTTIIADERYIRDSIVLPNERIVAGYPAIMPTFQGQLDESELLLLIAYIKSLGTESGESQR